MIWKIEKQCFVVNSFVISDFDNHVTMHNNVFYVCNKYPIGYAFLAFRQKKTVREAEKKS